MSTGWQRLSNCKVALSYSSHFPLPVDVWQNVFPLNYNPPPLRQKIPPPSPLIINGLRLRVGSTSKVMKFSVGGIIRPSIAENS